MKLQLIAGTLLAALAVAAAGSGPAEAAYRKNGRQDCCDCRTGEPAGRPAPARLGKRLGLTAEQSARVEEILAEERTRTEPLRAKIRASRDELRKVVEAKDFDEVQMRKLAAAESEVRSELLVAHARTRNMINALLTPAQREKAQRLLPPPPGGGFGPPDGPPDWRGKR